LFIERVSSFNVGAASKLLATSISSTLINTFTFNSAGFVSNTIQNWLGSNNQNVPIEFALDTNGAWSTGVNCGDWHGGCGGDYSHAYGGRYGTGYDAEANFSNVVEYYNGTSWNTWPYSLTTKRCYCGTIGNAGNSMVLCGYNHTGNLSTCEEENTWGWIASPNWGVATQGCTGVGTLGAGMAIGGSAEGTKTYDYDGVSWSAGANLVSSRNAHGVAGTISNAYVFGGGSVTTEHYDGSAWSTTTGSLVGGLNSQIGSGDGAAGTNAGAMATYDTTAEMYDAVNDVWSIVDSPTFNRRWA